MTSRKPQPRRPEPSRPEARRPQPPRPRSARHRAVRLLLVLGCVGVLAGATVTWLVIAQVGRAPRIWAPYIERRASGHDPLIVGTAGLVARWLLAVDRLKSPNDLPWPSWVGANPRRLAELNPAHLQAVSTTQELFAAVARAKPGDVIELMPGRYRLDGSGLHITRPGTAAQPITMQALRLGDAVIESNVVEAIKVFAPYWHFVNLEMHGVCHDDSGCEHAFHVVGNAHDTVLRNLRLLDFNAQLKVNREGGKFPDDGVLVDSTLIDTHPRDTTNPVTPVNIDDASHWYVAGNLIADFVKGGGQTSYGGYGKGDAYGTVFRRNVVLCAYHLHGLPGPRVGLSFGGGGTGAKLRRDYGRTPFEHHDGKIEDNLIAFCSDVGIYLNRAAHTRIAHNTLIDTGGIDVRYPESSAEILDNIVDGAIHARQGAVITAMRGNLNPPLLGLFLGWHPQRGLFVDPARLNLRWRAAPPAGEPARAGRRDLCGTVRGKLAPPGAFADFSRCLRDGVRVALPTPRSG